MKYLPDIRSNMILKFNRPKPILPGFVRRTDNLRKHVLDCQSENLVQEFNVQCTNSKRQAERKGIM